jgi:hypothetical protein
VLGELGPARPGRLLLAFDEAVKRRVWIHGVTDAPAVSPSRRHLARPGRLRWLTGHRAGSDGWDAYEAPDGAALRNVAATPQRWRIVKHWLSELAREIDHGVADGTLHSLSLDRVWITGRGQPVLLDFSLGPATPELPTDVESRQQFLQQAAGAALIGWRDSGSVAIERPLPLPARRTLTTLECAGFESFHDVRAALEDLRHRPDEISRRLRVASLLLPGAPVLWLISVILYVLRRFDALAVVEAPDAGRLFAGAFAIVAVLAGVTAFASRGGVVPALVGDRGGYSIRNARVPHPRRVADIRRMVAAVGGAGAGLRRGTATSHRAHDSHGRRSAHGRRTRLCRAQP